MIGIKFLGLLATFLWPVVPWAQGVAPISKATVVPTGAPTAMTLAAATSQQGVLLDTFRQVGDTDDTASLTRAVAAGVTVLLGPKTYRVHDFIMAGTPVLFVMKGVRGASIIQRASASSSQFFDITARTVYMDGVTFDMNKASVAANQWGVFLGAGGQTVWVTNSTFKNNSGALGNCFALLGAGPAGGGSFQFDHNEVTGCASQGTYFGSVSNGNVGFNNFHDNSGFGVFAGAFLSATGTNYLANVLIHDNIVDRNVSGISVGGFAPPYTFGTPAASNVTVTNNLLQDNSGAAIALQGDYLFATLNRINQSSPSVPVNTGIDSNARYGLISDNDIQYAGSSYGIDIGGSVETPVRNNNVTINSGTALNVGGTQNVSVQYNKIDVSGSAIAFLAYNVETDGNGRPFPTICSNLDIEWNAVNLSGGSAQGLLLEDDAGGQSGSAPTIFKNNSFTAVSGAISGNAVNYWAGGSALSLGGNLFNGTGQVFSNPNGSNDIVFPDVYDIIFTAVGASPTIRSYVPAIVNNFNAGGSILWVLPNSGGSGYTAATNLAASGSGGGSGWTGTPLIYGGAIIGVRTITRGTGYSGTLTVTATDTGGGTGATFLVTNLPSLLSGHQIGIGSSSVTSVVETSGGAVTIQPSNALILQSGVAESVTLTANGGTRWNAAVLSRAVFPIGSLPPSNATTCTAPYTGAIVDVTGSVSGAWQARCDGSNWIAPSGSTIN